MVSVGEKIRGEMKVVIVIVETHYQSKESKGNIFLFFPKLGLFNR
jgi:hypothetical protein